MIKAVLFDLDGTLLPMDQDNYLGIYFKHLAMNMAKRGYEPKEFIDNLVKCTYMMLKNDGSKTNEQVFWDSFAAICGEGVLNDRDYVDEFYKKDFIYAKEACGFAPEAALTVRSLKDRGYKVALATNPLFPRVAIEERIKWAGLDPNDFELITTYENSRYCKPRAEYYRWVAESVGVLPEECLMVGNDASDDMPAADTGMKVFLLTDCLINSKNIDISVYPRGSFAELDNFIKSL